MAICLAWDIDGTLLRVRPGTHSVDDELIFAIVDELVGEPRFLDGSWGKTELQIFTELLGPDLASHALDRFEAEWTQRWDPTHYVAYPGVADVLAELATPDHHHVILTGNILRRAQDKVRAVELAHYFDWDRGAYGDESIYRGDLVANLRTRTDVPVIVIGDTPRDIDAAHAHDVPVVAVATGRYTVEELTAEGADLVITDFAEGRDAFLAFIADFGS